MFSHLCVNAVPTKHCIEFIGTMPYSGIYQDLNGGNNSVSGRTEPWDSFPSVTPGKQVTTLPETNHPAPPLSWPKTVATKKSRLGLVPQYNPLPAILSLARASVTMEKIGQIWKTLERSSNEIWGLPSPSYLLQKI